MDKRDELINVTGVVRGESFNGDHWIGKEIKREEEIVPPLFFNPPFFLISNADRCWLEESCVQIMISLNAVQGNVKKTIILKSATTKSESCSFHETT